MPIAHFLLFASDATLAAIGGAALLALALLAALAERRRSRRKAINAVGWAPWTAIFLGCFFGGVALLVLAVKGWAGE